MLAILPEQCRAARALLDWSQQDLARRAKVARKTVADFELRQVTPYARTLRDVVEAFESAGISFLAAEENVAGPGVRLRLSAPLPEILPQPILRFSASSRRIPRFNAQSVCFARASLCTVELLAKSKRYRGAIE